jgi:hypothetical protein
VLRARVPPPPTDPGNDDELHQQAVVPTVTFSVTLVCAHHPDRPKPSFLVPAGCGCVAEGRIDCHPMMPAFLNQVLSRTPHHLGAPPTRERCP